MLLTAGLGFRPRARLQRARHCGNPCAPDRRYRPYGWRRVRVGPQRNSARRALPPALRAGTLSPAIVKQVAQLFERPEPRSAYCKLFIDATGVGRPVVDLFEDTYRRGELRYTPMQSTLPAAWSRAAQCLRLIS